jgi:hypothetical protein
MYTREQFNSEQSRRYVEDAFGGSLPGFIASFFGGRKLTPEQAAELRRIAGGDSVLQRQPASNMDLCGIGNLDCRRFRHDGLRCYLVFHSQT